MTQAAPTAVLFDFDGTLADTAPDMIAALNDWLQARARAPVAEAAVRVLCSSGARVLLEHCGGTGEEDIDSAVEDYLRRYERTAYRRTALFAGIAEHLDTLAAAGVPWGVATNKPLRYFAPIAEQLLARYRPAALVARDDTILRAKPHPDTLHEAARQCNCPRAIYVGDDIRDGMAAQAAQMPFVAVTWGYWREAQWQEATPAPPIAAKLATPQELLPALAQLGCALPR